MTDEPVARVGRWSTAAGLTHELLEVLTAPDRDLRRRGPYWAAAQLAREQGLRGSGRRIAILDSGFDLSLVGTDGVELSPETSSRGDPSAEHGTVVALLVRYVAPDAALYLADVSAPAIAGPGPGPGPGPGSSSGPGSGRAGGPDVRQAALALRAADAWGADIVVCSFEFTSDAVKTGRDPRVFLDLEAPTEAVAAALTEWSRAGFKTFEPGGCLSECELCTALSELGDDRPLVFSAAGNDARNLGCPAVHDRALACGFNALTIVGAGESASEQHGNPAFEQSLAVDIAIEEIPGFRGTSFAAPLVAAFAALGSVADFGQAAVGMAAANVVAARDVAFRTAVEGGRNPGNEVAASIDAGYRISTIDLGPQAHQVHGNPPAPPYPCPLCSFAFAYPWQNRGLLLLNFGELDAADDVLTRAAAIAPRAYGLLVNLARLHRSRAEGERDHLQRLRLFVQSVATYETAARWASDEPLYSRFADEAWDEALADPTEPVLVPGRPLTSLPAVAEQAEGSLVAYGGEAADPMLIRAGHAALARRELDQAATAFGAVEASEGPLRDERDFGSALTMALQHNLDAAASLLTGPADSGTDTLRFWARYNRALIDEAREHLDDAHTAFIALSSEEVNLPYADAARVSRKLGRTADEQHERRRALAGELDPAVGPEVDWSWRPSR